MRPAQRFESWLTTGVHAERVIHLLDVRIIDRTTVQRADCGAVQARAVSAVDYPSGMFESVRAEGIACNVILFTLIPGFLL